MWEKNEVGLDEKRVDKLWLSDGSWIEAFNRVPIEIDIWLEVYGDRALRLGRRHAYAFKNATGSPVSLAREKPVYAKAESPHSFPFIIGRQDYPTDPKCGVNILRSCAKTHNNWGYADHSETEWRVPLCKLAVGMGARIIEAHITGLTKGSSQDECIAMTPAELSQFMTLMRDDT